MILDTLATVALSPILLVQALRVRKIAQRLPEAAGPRHGSIGTGPDLRILIVGDSSAAGVGVGTQGHAFAGQLTAALAPYRTVHWTLIANTGATTPSLLAKLGAMALPQSDISIVILGVNDVTRGRPRAGWLKAHQTLRNLLRSKSDARRLYISEIPPLGAFPLLPNPLRWILGRRAARFGVALSTALKGEKDTRYMPLPDMLDVSDMAEDGFHPGPTIYTVWAKEMARQILSDEPPT